MDALERAMGLRHALELAPGQVTEGLFDLRPYVERYGLPDRMDGMRALEVGTWDGFWAFEMERRGAEVVALDLDDERDLDWPATAATGILPRRAARRALRPRAGGARLRGRPAQSLGLRRHARGRPAVVGAPDQGRVQVP